LIPPYIINIHFFIVFDPFYEGCGHRFIYFKPPLNEGRTPPSAGRLWFAIQALELCHDTQACRPSGRGIKKAVAAGIKALHCLNEQHVPRKDRHQVGKVGQRKRSEPERGGEHPHWQEDPERQDQDRSDQKRPRRPALEKGIFCVRIVWTMSVWEKSPSINQPDWNSVCFWSVLAPNTNHIKPYVTMSKSELMGPKWTMNRPIPAGFQRLGSLISSSSTLSKGMAVCEKS